MYSIKKCQTLKAQYPKKIVRDFSEYLSLFGLKNTKDISNIDLEIDERFLVNEKKFFGLYNCTFSIIFFEGRFIGIGSQLQNESFKCDFVNMNVAIEFQKYLMSLDAHTGEPHFNIQAFTENDFVLNA